MALRIRITGVREAKEALQRLKRDAAREILRPAVLEGGKVVQKQAVALTRSPRVQEGLKLREGLQSSALVAAEVHAEIGGPYAERVLGRAVEIARERALQAASREAAGRIDREVKP